MVSPDDFLPVCRKLAEDMLSADKYVIREYKRLINLGFDKTLAEGKELELEAHLKYSKTSVRNFDGSRLSIVLKKGQDQQKHRKRGETMD